MNGFWVWQAVHGGGAGGIVSLPYDCNAGFRHRATGWSPGKKSWCDSIALDDLQNRKNGGSGCLCFVSWDFSPLWDVCHCHIHSEFNQWQIMGKVVGDVVLHFAKLKKSPQRVEVAKTRRLAAWM